MKQVRCNPTVNNNITLTTYAFTATGASGTITASGGVNMSAMTTGDSIFLGLDGGSSNGYTDVGEYFVTNVASGSLQVATTEAKAMAGTADLTASGDAGAGTVYPNYKVGGVLAANTAGDLWIRGIGVSATGWDTFSKQTTVLDGTFVPYMIGEVSASGTTATGLVGWIE